MHLFVWATPYHNTKTLRVWTTTNADKASALLLNVCTLRVTPDDWPKEIRKLKHNIRFVVKEAGERSFLVVLLKEIKDE